ncbi:MAG TPA: methyltransferase domain-containing protein [Candidatus Acidoferrum sp.]
MTQRDLVTSRRRGLFGRRVPTQMPGGESTALVKSRPARNPVSQLTRTQEYFLEWNAQRLGITFAESHARYIQSWDAVPHGHNGRAFEKFHGQCYELFRVFADDRPTEVIDAYKLHAVVHFLTMLTYPEPQWFDEDVIVKQFRNRSAISILDFGCGLAQHSRTLAEYMLAKGLKVNIALADIPTVREDFLIWWGKRCGIPTTFLECSVEHPIPELPQVDLCFALEFFEHVYDPVTYFIRINEAMTPGGVLVTNFSDHHKEFMHVSPQLAPLREAVQERGYEEIFANFIYRKPHAAP